MIWKDLYWTWLEREVTTIASMPSDLAKFRDDLYGVIKVAPVDFELAAGGTRAIIEQIARSVHSVELHTPNGKPLIEMIKSLREKGKIPPRIASYMHLIRVIGNIGVHKLGGVEKEDVFTLYLPLLRTLSWYFCEWEGTDECKSIFTSAVPPDWFAFLCHLRNERKLPDEAFRQKLNYIAERELPESSTDPEVLDRLSDGNASRQEARGRQVLTGIELGQDVRIDVLGIPFVLIPPTTHDKTDKRSPFYVAETPLSEVDWHRFIEAESGLSPAEGLAKTGIAVTEVEKWLRRANEKIAPSTSRYELGFPTLKQWEAFAATQEKRVSPAGTLKRPVLKKTQPSALGLYDVLGMVYQYCSKDEHTWIRRGGCYRTPSLGRELGVENTGYPYECTGFRPVLAIGKNINL